MSNQEPPADAAASAPARNPAWLEAAAALGARLCRDAVWDGARCNWLGDSSEVVGQAWTVVHKAMGPELYDGTAGIALFLAHLHALTGERPFRTAAEGALRHVLSRRAHVGRHAAVSFHSGKSGVAYVLSVAGDVLGTEEYRKTARELADEVTRAEPDPALVDVISGSAGAIPALLDFAERFGGDAFQAAAIRHGEHLLSIARPGPAGTSWRTLEMDTRDLTGYSHGAAGVALALLELFHRTGDARFKTVAEDGFRYERSHFNPQYGNWPDFRSMEATGHGAGTGEPSYSLAWCHGAPGIGLSRVRAWQLTGDATYRQEADAAIRTTAHALQATAQSGSAGFSLCHGDAGNAELFVVAEEAFGGGRYRAVAEQVAAQGISWYLRQRAPWPCGIPDGGETPNLMLGLAGIGYFYLRLYDPAAVPSILLLVPPRQRGAAPGVIDPRQTEERIV